MNKFTSINCACKDQLKVTVLSMTEINSNIPLKKNFLLILLGI